MDIIFCNENSTFEAEKYIIKVYKCLICGIEFNFKPDLRKHIEKQHLDFILTPKIKNEAIDKTEIKTEPEETDLLIDSNDFLTNDAKDLKGHMISVYEGKEPIKCSSCETNFTLKSSLNQHIASVHGGKKFSNPKIFITSVSDIQTIPTHYSKLLFDVLMNQNNMKTKHDQEILEKNNAIARLREKLAELEKGNNTIQKPYIQCLF